MACRPFTTSYLLAAVDLRWTPDGGIGPLPPDQAIYRTIFARTFAIAAGVTLITLVLGFPLAWLLANLPGPTAARLILLVLLPFWTSILVRTAAWTVLLQKFGILNELLLGLHVIDHPHRPDVHAHRPDHRHDAHPASVHAAADLQRHAHDLAVADAGGLFAGRAAVRRVPRASICRR